MAGEWKTAKIGDCFDLVGGYAFKSGEFIENGIPVIKIKNVKANRMLFDDLSYVAPEFLKTRAEKVVQKGDLLITMSGNRFDGSPDTWVGKVAQFNEDQPFMLNQRVGILRPRKGAEVDRRFFAFSLSSHFYQTEFIAIATSSGGQANLSPSQILGAPIEYPPLAEQKAIAEVLGALDDKIELNRRMNATLEAMARALFQSWFVDFDPVRAKLDGREPSNLDPSTAALFPASFQDTELGHIPAGWSVKPLSELCSYLGRGIGPAYVDTGGVLVLNQKCIRNHRVNPDLGRRHNDQKKSIHGRLVEKFDILVNSTGTGTLGRVAQVFQLPELTIVDSHVTIVRSSAETDPLFLGVNLVNRELEIEGLGEGSTGQTELSRIRLGSLSVITPTPDIQKVFGKLVHPIFERISANDDQSRTLATLRDTLLPKLLSGELRVAEVQSGKKATA